MKLGSIKISYLLGANLLPAIYLLWWDQRGQFTPAALSPIWKSDLIALISMILLVLLLFIAAFLFVVKRKFSWKWLLGYLPFALYVNSRIIFQPLNDDRQARLFHDS